MKEGFRRDKRFCTDQQIERNKKKEIDIMREKLSVVSRQEAWGKGGSLATKGLIFCSPVEKIRLKSEKKKASWRRGGASLREGKPRRKKDCLEDSLKVGENSDSC